MTNSKCSDRNIGVGGGRRLRKVKAVWRAKSAKENATSAIILLHAYENK